MNEIVKVTNVINKIEVKTVDSKQVVEVKSITTPIVINPTPPLVDRHTHANKSVLDSITSTLIGYWNAAYNWIYNNGQYILDHIADGSLRVTQSLLDIIGNKVDKVEGKGLSTNDFTNEQKELLSQQSGVNTGDQDLSGLEPKRGVDDFYLTNAEKTQGALATGNMDYPSIKSIADELPILLGLALSSESQGGGGVTIDQVNTSIANAIDVYGTNTSKNKGLKLCTIGDSVTASNLWQPWLKKWGQLTYDEAETLYGVGGYAPLAVGGTLIRPFTVDNKLSIYTRGKDVINYIPDIITILVTGNDGLTHLGSINDTPYNGGENPPGDASLYTCYGAYMGLVEYILTNLKTAKIILLSNMVPRIDFNNDYNYDTAVAWNVTNRKPWADMAKSIASKYHLDYVDLYNESGVNELNCQSYYIDPGNVGSQTGLVYQVHPNPSGYKIMAKSIINKL